MSACASMCTCVNLLGFSKYRIMSEVPKDRFLSSFSSGVFNSLIIYSFIHWIELSVQCGIDGHSKAYAVFRNGDAKYK